MTIRRLGWVVNFDIILFLLSPIGHLILMYYTSLLVDQSFIQVLFGTRDALNGTILSVIPFFAAILMKLKWNKVVAYEENAEGIFFISLLLLLASVVTTFQILYIVMLIVTIILSAITLLINFRQTFGYISSSPIRLFIFSGEIIVFIMAYLSWSTYV